MEPEVNPGFVSAKRAVALPRRFLVNLKATPPTGGGRETKWWRHGPEQGARDFTKEGRALLALTGSGSVTTALIRVVFLGKRERAEEEPDG